MQLHSRKLTQRGNFANWSGTVEGGVEMIKFSGLCSCCKNAPYCTFPRNANSPIWHCDEFDGFECKTTNRITKNFSPQSKTPNSELLGLCRNCENRNLCQFPKPEGGIWHCEEYR